MNAPHSSSTGRDQVAVAIEDFLHRTPPSAGRLRITKKPDGFLASFHHIRAFAAYRDIALLRLAALLLEERELREPLVKALRGPYAIHDRHETRVRRHLRSE